MTVPNLVPDDVVDQQLANPLLISIPRFLQLVPIGKTSAFLLIQKGELRTCKVLRRTFILMESVEQLIQRGMLDRPS